MGYAEVAVDALVSPDRTFSYGVPKGLPLSSGQMVLVPFGPRLAQGVVTELAGQPQVEEVKEVIDTLHPSPLIGSVGLKLGRWISRYYLCSLFDALVLMLPPGFKERVRPYFEIGFRHERPLTHLSEGAQNALSHLQKHSRIGEAQLKQLLKRNSERELASLLRRGFIRRKWELLRPSVVPHYQRFIRSTVFSEPAQKDASALVKMAHRQRALLEALAEPGGKLPLALANKEYGSGAVSSLWEKGLLAMEWIRSERESGIKLGELPEDSTNIQLTEAQEKALSQIVPVLEGRTEMPRSFLLHGVTGSGKTEVYLRALERCVALGRRGLFLVPEIALTPQTVHRLNVRFPGRVAVIHSGLPIGAQFDQWWRIGNGEYDVVVGARSALFAPLSELGLIVIDEEHEWTYKQEEVPRYHAREVALRLGEFSGAVVVMGGATPDVESYFWARRGIHRLLELPHRVSSASSPSSPSQELARVEVCDMRRELKEGNRSIFSRALASDLKECVSQGHQAILFLNRRGTATVVQCRECGFVARCYRCSMPLTYHATISRLLCHQCNRRSSVPTRCPRCSSVRIRYLGLGTQRVVEEVTRLLPQASVLRWDADAARSGEAHQQIMERFSEGEAQVLVGTQMVAKGLHVPNVTLVGVILADLGLNMPDFRAPERAFQLLCQVAGRAGRGSSPGRVIVQTYDPDNCAVKAASSQEYKPFYEAEMRFRQQMGNPPFNELIHMVYLHTNVQGCQRGAQRMGRILRHKIASQGLTDVEVVGPAPAYPQRLRGRYRWHLLLRGHDLHSFLEGVAVPEGWMVDVDPVTVL